MSRGKTNVSKRRMNMEIVTMIICCLTCIVVNYFVVFAACLFVLKKFSKTLIAIIDECEKQDKADIFCRVYNENTK